MAHLRMITGSALCGLAACAVHVQAASSPTPLTLPDSETAVAMTAPTLPARISGDCPSSDPCEFGTKWRVCEAVPVYREARDGAVVLRMLTADETFIAESAEIELIAPGEVEMLAASTPEQTGGLALAKGAKLAVYGPTQGQRALYFDPTSGKGWSPGGADDSFWWEEKKLAKLTRAPAMTWWLKAKLSDGQSGWFQLKAVPDLRNFPMFYTEEAMQSWDIDRTRDDESPDCGGVLEIKALMQKK